MLWVLSLLLGVAMVVFLVISFVIYHRKVTKRRVNAERVDMFVKCNLAGVKNRIAAPGPSNVGEIDIDQVELGHRVDFQKQRERGCGFRYRTEKKHEHGSVIPQAPQFEHHDYESHAEVSLEANVHDSGLIQKKFEQICRNNMIPLGCPLSVANTIAMVEKVGHSDTVYTSSDTEKKHVSYLNKKKSGSKTSSFDLTDQNVLNSYHHVTKQRQNVDYTNLYYENGEETSCCDDLKSNPTINTKQIRNDVGTFSPNIQQSKKIKLFPLGRSLDSSIAVIQKKSYGVPRENNGGRYKNKIISNITRHRRNTSNWNECLHTRGNEHDNGSLMATISTVCTPEFDPSPLRYYEMESGIHPAYEGVIISETNSERRTVNYPTLKSAGENARRRRGDHNTLKLNAELGSDYRYRPWDKMATGIDDLSVPLDATGDSCVFDIAYINEKATTSRNDA